MEVSKEHFDSEWDRIFGKKKDPEKDFREFADIVVEEWHTRLSKEVKKTKEGK